MLGSLKEPRADTPSAGLTLSLASHQSGEESRLHLPSRPRVAEKSVGGTQAHPPLARSRGPGPAALTCVTPLLAVAKALQSALGPGLGAHACGEAHVSSSGDPALNPRHLGKERPTQSNPVTGLGVLAYLPEAGSWEAGREAEVKRRPSTRQPPSPRRGRGHSAPHTHGPPTPPPLRATQGLRPAERVEPGPCTGRAGSDLGPGLTWAAARTFWYKLFPWRGSGGPAKTVGQMGAELSSAMPTSLKAHTRHRQ